ncbi:MAG: D-alanyl-D-alanine carboxypeptidase/D-alanyl-D-alanine-endopeptidase [Solirubrobacteraceae bacterium]
MVVVAGVVGLAVHAALGGGTLLGSTTRTGGARAGAATGRKAGTTGRTDGAHAKDRSGRSVAGAASARLGVALNRQLRAAGPDSGALVEDVSSVDTLFSRRAAVRRPPASVEKLWTTVALLRRLGPDTRFHTTVLGTGSVRGGVLHGNLYLRGGGDPTFGDTTFNQVWNGGQGPTASELTAQLVARGIHRVTGWLYGDESLVDRRRGGLLTNYGVDVPDFGGQLSALTYDHGATAAHYDPATFAAHELALTLRGSHIDVRASRRDGDTPSGAHVLATVSSPPIAAMTRLMDVPSDDLYAEMFAKQLGVLFGSGGTIAAGADVISDTIASDYGLHPLILDGSGLSRDDRSSPLEVVDLLREVWGTPVGRELAASMPTVGREGTVRGIGLRTRAAGNCIAKTGTLDDVTNLAGYCSTRGRRMLAFALMIDGPDNGSAELLESRMIGAVARY